MNRQQKKERQERQERVQAAYDASADVYTATLDAPPHPHIALGLAVGEERLSAMEAVVSMQAYARSLGADGVLGVSICAVPTLHVHAHGRYVAYGTAVKWAAVEE
ncbi:heavy metal-binding domain-containing protein [Streptomyces griseus]|uniref:heavy metal-binding domain-containing protein n=1 Tax=Streptomyces griseus TaxID=1911 RepID=UPI00056B837A|nr:heavy metal-binding domain-containing protein [Streptomyces griseus]